MAYEVLARKWRPQRFAEVVGQDHVTRTLANAIESDRLAHAYLFVGPRGTGKTTTARILAKALNCSAREGVEPCNRCDSCVEIIRGGNLDVIEVDGASNRGIDNVKTLRDNVRYAPVRGPYKIYIIDEVHMLTTEAFNAILKTLEEPPPHVKFFFATTEPQKVLTTILSRCQRFDLRRISIADLTRQLKKIAAAEEIEISDDALLAVARGAEGGLRDAESALDQLVSFRGKTIEESDVLAVFGLISRAQLNGLCAAVLSNDLAGIIQFVAEIEAAGKDVQRVVIELLDHFRNLLVIRHAKGSLDALDLPETQIEVLREQAGDCQDGRLLRIIEILIEAEGRMRYALSKRTLLEAALIRAAQAAVTLTLDELIAQVAALKPNGEEAAPASDPDPTAAPPVEKKNVRMTDEPERLRAAWAELTDRICRGAPHARSALADAQPLSVSDSHVVIALDSEFATERATLATNQTQAIIRQTLSSFLHRPVAIRFELRKDTGASVRKLPRSAADKEAYYRHPAIHRVVETFSGEITEIRK